MGKDLEYTLEDKQMAKKHVKRWPTSFFARNCKLKLQYTTSTRLLGVLKSKKPWKYEMLVIRWNNRNSYLPETMQKMISILEDRQILECIFYGDPNF